MPVDEYGDYVSWGRAGGDGSYVEVREYTDTGQIKKVLVASCDCYHMADDFAVLAGHYPFCSKKPTILKVIA